MAYAALVFLDHELQQILPQHGDYVFLYEKEQMESLHSSVIFLQKFLEDFPGNSSLVKQLESQITDVAYEVSDIITLGITHKGYKKTIESCIKEVHSAVEDAKEIRNVLERKANIIGRYSWITSSSSTVTVAAPSCDDTEVGLYTDLIQIKEQIFGRASKLLIIPITGMGGIGKTTLARNLYEDPVIVAHFDVRSWVTVSQEHNTEKILKEILGDTEVINGEPLIVGVHKKLTGRRFLIILDDIWSVEACDSVRNAFQDDNKGSRVIITTRLTEVATEVGSSSPVHEMQLMNKVQSWELFQKEVFGQHECCPPQMEHIGKTISNNCKGLPLAIVVIARLLKLNHEQNYWEKFARNMNEAMVEATHENQLMDILSLSYDNLPSHLKACFLYMSMFPEDYEIPTKKLMWLWAAEGFLKPERGRSIEEVAEKCLVDLVHRNLMFVGKKRSNGRIRTCIVHDVLRDVSLRKAKEEKFSQQIISRSTGKLTKFTKMFIGKHIPWFKDKITSKSQLTVYRRCVGTPAISQLFADDKTKCAGYVYSLILHHPSFHEDLLPTIGSNLLRVLDIVDKAPLYFTVFGVNLRYFAFTYRSVYKWNNSMLDDLNATLANICKMKNLETLIIRSETKPSGNLFFPILEMPKLKYFVVPATWHNYCIIDNQDGAICNNYVSKNSLLRTLSGVMHVEFTRDTTEIFASLVKLKIWYKRIDVYCLYNLVCLHQLEELNIRLYRLSLLPTNIAFPDKLKKITLGGPFISREIMSVIGSLPNLQVLKLNDCNFESEEWEPVEGQFQRLTYLKLGVWNLVEWKVESAHFPYLEQLILYCCQKLEELPFEIGEIESLQKLVIEGCTEHIGDSAMRIQKEQQSYGNCQLQVFVLHPYGMREFGQNGP